MNKLLLLSGQDLPFVGGRSVIHQPRIKDIALIGQNLFYMGTNFLCFSKDKLNDKDKSSLSNQTNFDILMSIINSNAEVVQESITAAQLMLTLLFPDYELKKMPNLLLLNKVLQDGSKEQCIINNDNFEEFKEIIQSMFCLDIASQSQYNPANKKAAQIANKLQKRKQMLEKKKGNSNGEIHILYTYILALTLGNHHTIPELMEYTVYQLFTQFAKFEKKYNYDIWLQAKMAGAENLQDAENWITDEERTQPTQKLPSSRRIQF